MDRPISNSQKRLNSGKWIFRTLLGIAVLGGAFFLLRKVLTTQVDSDTFRFAKVDRGTIENTITASGVVTPSFEQQINAPIGTEIKKVFLNSGTQVGVGDQIMELDQEFIQLQYESLEDKLELKRNNITKLKLEYEKNLRELEYENEIKALELADLQAKVKDIRHLKSIGGATEEEVEQAELKLGIAQLEKKKLENNLEFRKTAIVSDRRNLELEAMIQGKELKELGKKLTQTTVTAPIPGVITWLKKDIGEKVEAGTPLVRLANLQEFHIEASCSDRYADLVRIGQAVKVRISGKSIQGIISSILPAVTNNTISFIVGLNENNHSTLRPNMQVEVFIIADQKEDVLRVRNGPAFTGGRQQKVFVVNGDQAEARTIQIGLTNSEYVELTGGDIREGDRIIISEVKNFDHLDFLELKNN
ncbi:MAG: HlyD family efflux transporter periplasmic adaptor subunit [Bacteroidota bacterium]